MHSLVASVIMKIVYGHEVLGEGPDEFMLATERAVSNLSDAISPGAWLVNSLPSLRFLPRWFPGCRAFNKFAQETKDAVRVMAHESYEHATNHSVSTPQGPTHLMCPGEKK
jgi:hypothetical protein